MPARVCVCVVVRQAVAGGEHKVLPGVHWVHLEQDEGWHTYWKYAGDVGLPTLKDIMAELAKPGRDPRDEFEAVTFAEGVTEISQLEQGMELPGIVTNVTNFGAFVDIGIKESGLVHISQLANKFVKNPADVVHLGQEVTVKVMEVDLKRGRVQLSMKEV